MWNCWIQPGVLRWNQFICKLCFTFYPPPLYIHSCVCSLTQFLKNQAQSVIFLCTHISNALYVNSLADPRSIPTNFMLRGHEFDFIHLVSVFVCTYETNFQLYFSLVLKTNMYMHTIWFDGFQNKNPSSNSIGIESLLSLCAYTWREN